MILIEQDAKRLLMERLDECLKVHADMLDAQNIGSIYELQGFSELHYYLKVEHVFTPAEVEALLSFQDPLDVARWCWEENNHEHSFPICDLLKEIDAEQKFEHFTSEPSAQDKYTLLMKRLGQNYLRNKRKRSDPGMTWTSFPPTLPPMERKPKIFCRIYRAAMSACSL